MLEGFNAEASLKMKSIHNGRDKHLPEVGKVIVLCRTWEALTGTVTQKQAPEAKQVIQHLQR